MGFFFVVSSLDNRLQIQMVKQMLYRQARTSDAHAVCTTSARYGISCYTYAEAMRQWDSRCAGHLKVPSACMMYAMKKEKVR